MRINDCIHPTNPERVRLLELADGMEVDLPSGFVPNGEAPETRSPLRKMYIKAHLAVDCMFYAIYTQGLAFLFKTETAIRIKGVHFSLAHWAKKAEKASGKPAYSIWYTCTGVKGQLFNTCCKPYTVLITDNINNNTCTRVQDDCSTFGTRQPFNICSI